MSQYFSRPVKELVAQRKSVRTYRDESLAPELKQKLLDNLVGLPGINEKPVKLLLIDKQTASGGARVGTYGLIRGARHYIAAVCEEGDTGTLLQLGYKLETFVLYALSLGLGTVWLGGTFSKGLFAKAAGLKEDEILPIVMPVGYIAEKRSLIETLMRKTAGSALRMGWNDLFFDGESLKPLSGADAGAYRDALEAVRLAPSAMNAQPWRIIRQEGKFLFYKASRHAQTGFDMHLIDMGIALCHFELAAREAGLKGNWCFAQPERAAVPESYEFITAWQS